MSWKVVSRIRTAALLAMALVGLAGPAAPAAADPPPASLDSLLTAAMRANPRLQSLAAAAAAARERIPQAGALPDPMLEYMAEDAPLSHPAPSRSAKTHVGLSQTFPFPGKQGSMESSASAEAEIATLDLARARLEVAADLRKAFYDLYLLYASIDVLDVNQTTLRDVAAGARTRYEVGVGNQQDLLKANVELAVETNQLVVLRAQVPSAVAKLNAILNRPMNAPLGRPVLGDTTAAPLDPAALEQRALGTQPALRSRERAVAKSEADLRLARKTGLPDLTVGGEYAQERAMPATWTWTLGLSLPIWRWNKVAPARREAEQALASTRADREQTANDVRFGVRDAWTAVTTARTLVNLYRDSVLPQAEQSLASTRAAYENNKVDFLNLLDSQRSLLQARLEYQKAVTDYLKSRADLGLAVGDPAMLGVEGMEHD